MAPTDPGSGRPFLERLASEEIAALRARALTRRFERGATLMHHTEVPSRVLVVERGHAKVTLMSEDGREVILAFRGPGDLLGEVSALGGEPRSATVRALDPIDALAMSAGDFNALIEDHPRLALVVLRVVMERLREADRNQFEFAAYQTLNRVARRIVELAERFGEPRDGGVRITLGISQEELAGWAGASREATSKALHDLRAMSLIATERRHITVRSVDELRRIA
jgi:CRP/FNR family transcriptional regulator, cyclic AMP receptor protein